MEIIEIILIRYILGFGLQSFILVLGIYTFNKQKLIFKDYLVTSILVTMVSFFMKYLPITVGVQTIMNMLFTYLICVAYLKMQPYKTIRSTAFCVVLILLSEMVVSVIAVSIIGQDQFKIIINDSSQGHYIGAMANIVFLIIITSLYYRLIRKGDYHGSISQQNIG